MLRMVMMMAMLRLMMRTVGGGLVVDGTDAGKFKEKSLL